MYNFLQQGPQICFDADSPGGDGHGGQNEKQNAIDVQQMNAEITGDYGKYNRMVQEDIDEGGNGKGTGANSNAPGAKKGSASGSSAGGGFTSNASASSINRNQLSAVNTKSGAPMAQRAIEPKKDVVSDRRNRAALSSKRSVLDAFGMAKDRSITLSDEEQDRVGALADAQSKSDAVNKGLNFSDFLGASTSAKVANRKGEYGVAESTKIGNLTTAGKTVAMASTPFGPIAKGAGMIASALGWGVDKLFNNPAGEKSVESFTPASEIDTPSKSSPSTTQSAFGGDNNEEPRSTSKSNAARAGAQAVATAKAVPKAKTSANSLTETAPGEDDDFSLYRRMLNGFFKGARV